MERKNSKIKDLNKELIPDLIRKIDSKTKPIGALGRLEEIALQIGLILNSQTPEIKKPTVFVFAADHGLADKGVSSYPKEVTHQMVLNFLNGGAAINVFARQNNLDLMIVDAGIDFDLEEHPQLIIEKIAYGTNNILEKPAMSLEQCKKAIFIGMELMKSLYKNGSNTIILGDMGIGNTSSASLLMSKLCKLPVSKCTGRGTGLDDIGLQKKICILEKAILKHNYVSNNSLEIMSTFGGFEIAMMTGAILQAAGLGMIIIIDGFIVTSALLVAYNIDKKVLDYCIFSHQSDEQAHEKMLEFLGVTPLLNLRMRLGEGSGAAITFPIIQSAVNFLNQMASFKSASVSNKQKKER